METIQVTTKARRLIERFGTIKEFGDSYAAFQGAMLEAMGVVTELLEYYNTDIRVEGKDLAPLIALQQYAELGAELHKGFEEAEKAAIKPFGAAD